MSTRGKEWVRRLMRSGPARRVAEALFRASAHRHLARLDQSAPDRCQLRTLLGLVHHARATRFGVEHDFRRVRTAADFRRLVGLTTPAELWRGYWQPAFPRLAGATWPGPLPHLPHVSRDERHGTVSLSPALQAAHRAALQTALALVLHARPRARLLGGTLLLLGDEGLLAAGGGRQARAAEEALAGRFPRLARPFARAVPAGLPRTDFLAEAVALTPITCLVGPGARLVALLERVRTVRQAGGLAGAWPELTAVLHSRRGTDDYAGRLRELVGPGVLLLDMVARPEGVVAVEDPRSGKLRLLVDHGLYYEFVPAGQANDPATPRLGLNEVAAGTRYELILTSPAGWWACRTGITLVFAGTQPPLLDVLEAGPPPEPALRPEPAAEELARLLTLRGPHPRSGGTPAERPESIFHSPWSAPGDRG